MPTSAKSKSSSRSPKPRAARPLDPARPFPPSILAKARTLAAKYQFVLWTEDGEWYGRGVELPHAMNDGKTPEACIANVRDTFVTLVAFLLEQGQTPPPPAWAKVRTEQVNIRLTAEERLALETAAKRIGSDGISDFVRNAALAAAN